MQTSYYWSLQHNELLEKLKQIDIIEEGEHIGTQGGSVTDLIDLKIAYGEPEVGGIMASQLWLLMDPKPTCVAGMGDGGIPLAMLISDRQGIYYTSVRKKPKKYGTKRLFEGHQPQPGDVYALVDDVRNTGGSLELMEARIIEAGATVSGCYVVIDRQNPKSKGEFKTLFTLDELRNCSSKIVNNNH
ncbi:hypothetical protein CL622_04335 [archaeon]|nr:hypothetical protein [archaeon]|tara:strand:+ start:2027 stop:2587 length:561 start_codon:yes stop_codon:yes gene_type:complete